MVGTKQTQRKGTGASEGADASKDAPRPPQEVEVVELLDSSSDDDSSDECVIVDPPPKPAAKRRRTEGAGAGAGAGAAQQGTPTRKREHPPPPPPPPAAGAEDAPQEQMAARAVAAAAASGANSLLRDLHAARLARAGGKGPTAAATDTSAVAASQPMAALRVLSQNIWFAEQCREQRAQALGSLVERLDPHVVALQEVTPPQEMLFRRSDWWKRYMSVSPVFDDERSAALAPEYYTLLLVRTSGEDSPSAVRGSTKRVPFSSSVMGRDLVSVTLNVGGGKRVRVATSHLESPLTHLQPKQWMVTQRQTQLRELTRVLEGVRASGGADCVLWCGDSNWTEERGAKAGAGGGATLKCPSCHEPCALRTSRTEKNPGRQFFTCQSKGCGFFQWCDAADKQALESGLNSDGPMQLPAGWVDAWTALRPGEEGFTFDTKRNKMLTYHLRERLDRFLLGPSDAYEASSIEIVGDAQFDGQTYERVTRSGTRTLPVFVSDHFGLLCTLTPK